MATEKAIGGWGSTSAMWPNRICHGSEETWSHYLKLDGDGTFVSISEYYTEMCCGHYVEPTTERETRKGTWTIKEEEEDEKIQPIVVHLIEENTGNGERDFNEGFSECDDFVSFSSTILLDGSEMEQMDSDSVLQIFGEPVREGVAIKPAKA